MRTGLILIFLSKVKCLAYLVAQRDAFGSVKGPRQFTIVAGEGRGEG